MKEPRKVLVLGTTGRTGGRVAEQLLSRGVLVRAIVRSRHRLPATVVEDPGLELVEADLLAMPPERFAKLIRDCDVVISCLGHNLNLRGIFGAPRRLVADATRLVCESTRSLVPPRPVRFILMSSVSVNRPARGDRHRGAAERAIVALIRAILPPAADNQAAADLLCAIGSGDPYIGWVVVRPDSLRDGDVSGYEVHDELVSTLVRPGQTNMANVADFMSNLVIDTALWERWRGGFPVIVNARGATSSHSGMAKGRPPISP
jgi:uncharacterized protein YbjT (DUF2867 family)